MLTVSRVVESATSDESSKDEDDHKDSDVDMSHEPEREKTAEEKANWMKEYAPYMESMYDKVKRKRGASAKAAQNLKDMRKQKKRRKR